MVQQNGSTGPVATEHMQCNKSTLEQNGRVSVSTLPSSSASVTLAAGVSVNGAENPTSDDSDAESSLVIDERGGTPATPIKSPIRSPACLYDMSHFGNNAVPVTSDSGKCGIGLANSATKLNSGVINSSQASISLTVPGSRTTDDLAAAVSMKGKGGIPPPGVEVNGVGASTSSKHSSSHHQHHGLQHSMGSTNTGSSNSSKSKKLMLKIQREKMATRTSGAKHKVIVPSTDAGSVIGSFGGVPSPTMASTTSIGQGGTTTTTVNTDVIQTSKLLKRKHPPPTSLDLGTTPKRSTVDRPRSNDGSNSSSTSSAPVNGPVTNGQISSVDRKPSSLSSSSESPMDSSSASSSSKGSQASRNGITGKCEKIPKIEEKEEEKEDEVSQQDVSTWVYPCSGSTETDSDLLGACNPGTSVNLDGVVWHESGAGILVVNVSWRGRSYVGTLLDCSRYEWAPPRPDFSASEADASSSNQGRTPKGRKRGLRPNASTNDLASSKGNGRNAKNNACAQMAAASSPAKVQPGGSDSADELSNMEPTDQEKQSASSGVTFKLPEKVTSTPHLMEEATFPILYACPISTCCKKFSTIAAVEYHRSHEHSKPETCASPSPKCRAQSTQSDMPNFELEFVNYLSRNINTMPENAATVLKEYDQRMLGNRIVGHHDSPTKRIVNEVIDALRSGSAEGHPAFVNKVCVTKTITPPPAAPIPHYPEEPNPFQSLTAVKQQQQQRIQQMTCGGGGTLADLASVASSELGKSTTSCTVVTPNSLSRMSSGTASSDQDKMTEQQQQSLEQLFQVVNKSGSDSVKDEHKRVSGTPQSPAYSDISDDGQQQQNGAAASLLALSLNSGGSSVITETKLPKSGSIREGKSQQAYATAAGISVPPPVFPNDPSSAKASKVVAPGVVIPNHSPRGASIHTAGMNAGVSKPNIGDPRSTEAIKHQQHAQNKVATSSSQGHIGSQASFAHSASAANLTAAHSSGRSSAQSVPPSRQSPSIAGHQRRSEQQQHQQQQQQSMTQSSLAAAMAPYFGGLAGNNLAAAQLLGSMGNIDPTTMMHLMNNPAYLANSLNSFGLGGMLNMPGAPPMMNGGMPQQQMRPPVHQSPARGNITPQPQPTSVTPAAASSLANQNMNQHKIHELAKNQLPKPTPYSTNSNQFQEQQSKSSVTTTSSGGSSSSLRPGSAQNGVGGSFHPEHHQQQQSIPPPQHPSQQKQQSVSRITPPVSSPMTHHRPPPPGIPTSMGSHMPLSHQQQLMMELMMNPQSLYQTPNLNYLMAMQLQQPK